MFAKSPSPVRRPSRLARTLSALSAVFLAVAAGCNDDPTDATVTAGTIGGVAFTVRSGTVLQPVADGPIAGGAAGALIVLDGDPAALGMSDPDRLHLRTQFALSDSGSLEIAAFGPSADPLPPDVSIYLQRIGAGIRYEFRLDGTVFADTLFTPEPDVASAEHWIVTEFYAQDVPGYGPGSGATMWPLDDLNPAFQGDVLGCADGPAMRSTTSSGDRVAYRLTSGFLTAIEVVDTIIGPCV